MNETLVPITGQLLDLAETPSTDIAETVSELGRVEAEIRSFRHAAADELGRRLDHEGRRSADVGDYHIEVNAPTEKRWDIPELQRALIYLVMHGLISEEKAKRCTKFEPKPVWGELKTLLSDPRCREQIERCFTEEPTTRSVRIRHG